MNLKGFLHGRTEIFKPAITACYYCLAYLGGHLGWNVLFGPTGVGESGWDLFVLWLTLFFLEVFEEIGGGSAKRGQEKKESEFHEGVEDRGRVGRCSLGDIPYPWRILAAFFSFLGKVFILTGVVVLFCRIFMPEFLKKHGVGIFRFGIIGVLAWESFRFFLFLLRKKSFG